MVKLKASYKVTEETKSMLKQRERDLKEAARRKVRSILTCDWIWFLLG